MRKLEASEYSFIFTQTNQARLQVQGVELQHKGPHEAHQYS